MHLKLRAAPLSFQSSAFLLGGVDLIIVPLGVGPDTDSLGHSWGVFVQDVLESITVSGGLLCPRHQSETAAAGNIQGHG